MPQPKPRSKKGKVVLLLTTTISISLIEEFESVTASAGLGFLVLYLNDKQYPQTELFDVIFSMHKSNLIYGVVFEGLTKELSQETIDLLNHYPSAQLGTDYNLKNSCTVFINIFQAAYDAAIHLLGRSNQRIVLFKTYTDQPKSSIDRMIINGVRSAFADTGKDIDQLLLIEADGTAEGIKEAVEMLESASSPMPDGFLCFEELSAFGCITKLQQLGYNIPEEIAVIALIEIKWFSNLSSPGISRIEYPEDKIAAEAIGFIRAFNEGESASGKTIYVEHKLVISNSTSSVE